jgi:hypothetical protein
MAAKTAPARAAHRVAQAANANDREPMHAGYVLGCMIEALEEIYRFNNLITNIARTSGG